MSNLQIMHSNTATNPPASQDKKKDTPNSTPTTRRARDSELFHKYSINYAAGLLTQKLGLGLRGLDAILAFLGIQPNHGSDVNEIDYE